MQKDYSYLLDVYKQTKIDESNFVDTQSIHWENYYKKENKFLKLENLINFRKNQVLSEGLDDSINLQNPISLLEGLNYFENSFLKKNLPKKNIGNCNFSVNLLDYYFDYGIIHHLKWYEKVEKYIENNSIVLEIGGGFGSFSRIILNNKNLKYFLIDLPEANLMTNYYLQSFFPEKKIFNYKDYKTSNLKENIEKYDIFILPPRILNKEDIKYDFIINTRSFMEMNKKIIKEYFDFIQSKINNNGYFLNINRYLKSTVSEDIKFSEYPYDDSWNIELSEKSFLQSNVHFLLTKRIGFKGNIRNELKFLKKNEIVILSSNFLKIKIFLKKMMYNLLKTVLNFLFSKDQIKKISKILFDLSSKKKGQ